MKYTVKLTQKVLKSLQKIDQVYVKKIWERIKLLETTPYPKDCLKLKNHDNSYRIRVGRYRIIYQIFDDQLYVSVINVDHRKDIYR